MPQKLKYEVDSVIGMRVKAYRNLTRKCISLMDENGHVIKHVLRVLLKDATPTVSRAGMERVIKTGHKNVHAFIQGEVVALDDDYIITSGKCASYNPRREKPYFEKLTMQGEGGKLLFSEFISIQALPDRMSSVLYDVKYAKEEKKEETLNTSGIDSKDKARDCSSSEINCAKAS